MTSPLAVWQARAENARAVEAVLATMERESEESMRPAVLPLRPSDDISRLIQRELRVYAPGRWFGYSGREPSTMLRHQYIDWRRDEFGWTDFELETRADATRLLRRQMLREQS